MPSIPELTATGPGGFLAFWLLVYGVLLALYFGFGLALEYLARRRPDRRIQTGTPSPRGRDIRLSMVSLVGIALYVAGGLWLQARGFTLFAVWDITPITVIAGLVISVLLYDAWFYWFHRMMHLRLFWRFHARHHSSVTPTPWSNNNDHPVGAFFEQSYFLFAPLLLPIPAPVFVLHKIWDQVTGMIGHAGYEFFAGPGARRPWPGVCTTYHDQHHSHFRVNFANTFTFWDRLCGTLHPRYDDTVRRFEDMGRR